jgi:hypothetical protein
MKNSFKTVRTLLITSAMSLLYLTGMNLGYAEMIKVPVITYISQPSQDDPAIVYFKWESRTMDIPNADDQVPRNSEAFGFKVHVPGEDRYFLGLDSQDPTDIWPQSGDTWKSIIARWIDTNGAAGSGKDVYKYTSFKDGQCYQIANGQTPMPGTKCMDVPMPNVSCQWDTKSATIALGTATDESSWEKLTGKTSVRLSCTTAAAVKFDVDAKSKSVGSGGNSELTLTPYQGSDKLTWPVDAMTSQKSATLDLVAGTSGKAPTAGSYNANFVVTASWE